MTDITLEDQHTLKMKDHSSTESIPVLIATSEDSVKVYGRIISQICF